LSLGTDAQRDWGFTAIMQAMWLMLQQEQPDDYVMPPVSNIRPNWLRGIRARGLADWQYVRLDPA
jgi:hypothetical protein